MHALTDPEYLVSIKIVLAELLYAEYILPRRFGKLVDLILVMDDEVWRILGIEMWEDQMSIEVDELEAAT